MHPFIIVAIFGCIPRMKKLCPSYPTWDDDTPELGRAWRHGGDMIQDYIVSSWTFWG